MKIQLSQYPVQSLREQLLDLELIEDGWYEDELAPRPSTIALATEVLCALECEGIPVPFLYPAYEQAVRAEWPGMRWSISLEVSDENLTVISILPGAVKAIIEKYPTEDWRSVSTLIAERLCA